MSLVPHPGTPITIPLYAHLAMWPALLAWLVFLARRRRTRSWPCSPRFGMAMIPGCLFVDAGALMAAIRWPSTASNSFILALLWLAVLFSATAFFALRTPTDGGGDDGDDKPQDDPEPPWWPDFERSSATTRGRDHRSPRGRRRHPPSRRRRRPALRRRAPLVGGRLEVQVPVDVRLQHLGEALHVLLVLGRAALDVAVGEDPRLVDLVVALLVGARDVADDAVGTLQVEGVGVGVVGDRRRVLAPGEVGPELGRAERELVALRRLEQQQRRERVGCVLLLAQHGEVVDVDQRVRELVLEDERDHRAGGKPELVGAPVGVVLPERLEDERREAVLEGDRVVRRVVVRAAVQAVDRIHRDVLGDLERAPEDLR